MSKAPPHHPHIAILTCADARLNPHTFPGTTNKQLFIVRVAGNIADTNAIASLEYAVGSLGTPEIWVIGHQDCGAVTTACKFNQGKVGPANLTPDLVHLMADILPVIGEDSDCGDEDVKRWIKSNAKANAEQLLQSKALREAVQDEKLIIKTGYYQWDGTIEWLPNNNELT